MRMHLSRLPLILACLVLGGCGRGSAPAGAPPQSGEPTQSGAPLQSREPTQSGAPPLIHTPPIGKMSDQQLRSLSMECEKYPVDKSARGPYEAAYCEAAIAAWSDAPLQMLPLKKE